MKIEYKVLYLDRNNRPTRYARGKGIRLKSKMRQNYLHLETSPYLLQHKDNAVHWQAWGEGALIQAKEEGKPILLSIGYAACHWCHVMAHESFESEEIAELINSYFISIKVDREERPDLDMIYQSALSMLGEQGGWPLTMFLTPDGEPFWGGTYFPPEPRFDRPGFPDVLKGIAAVYQSQPEKISENVIALRQGLKQLSLPKSGHLVEVEEMNRVAKALVREVDPFLGGIGQAPKFPQPMIFEQLWRAWKRTHEMPFFSAVTQTLDKICQGGIYDHVGGGFSRYSVDARWLVPHFEKMLYDNALLIELLTLVWQETKSPLYKARIEETVDWLMREMTTEKGGFASSLDADSENEEGKYYVWSESEIDKLLDKYAPDFKLEYDVGPNGNWEGKNILNRLNSENTADEKTNNSLKNCLKILLDERRKRIAPDKDDKVLADWNGLMIAALTNASVVFKRPNWLKAAKSAFSFIERDMIDGSRLMHSWRNGSPRNPATLDDYVGLARASLILFEVTGQNTYLSKAEAWIETTHIHYGDPQGGGYFFSADDTPHLITRSKTGTDSATPSGNGSLAGVLARLYFLTGKDIYRKRSEEIIRSFTGSLQGNLIPLSTLINSSEFLLNALQIILIGHRSEAKIKAMISVIYSISIPNRILQVLHPKMKLPVQHPAHGKGQINNGTTAYICSGRACSPPITDPLKLELKLREL